VEAVAVYTGSATDMDSDTSKARVRRIAQRSEYSGRDSRIFPLVDGIVIFLDGYMTYGMKAG
jgi:hypothetical protein